MIAASHSAHLAPSAQAGLSGACGQGLKAASPSTCSPAPSVITDSAVANYWTSLNSIFGNGHRL